MRVWHPTTIVTQRRGNRVILTNSDTLGARQDFDPSEDLWVIPPTSFFWTTDRRKLMQTLVRDETGFTAWKDFS